MNKARLGKGFILGIITFALLLCIFAYLEGSEPDSLTLSAPVNFGYGSSVILLDDDEIYSVEYDMETGDTLYHYHNGLKPSNGTEGILVAYYDGVSTVNFETGDVNVSEPNYEVGDTVRTWFRYKIEENTYVVIHELKIHEEWRIQKW